MNAAGQRSSRPGASAERQRARDPGEAAARGVGAWGVAPRRWAPLSCCEPVSLRVL